MTHFGQNAGGGDAMPSLFMGKRILEGDVWGSEDKERIKTTILDAVKQDPIIAGKPNITVTFGDAEKKELHVIGKLEDQRSRSRLREILEQNTPSNVEVHDGTIVG